jgi:hypothetical protein
MKGRKERKEKEDKEKKEEKGILRELSSLLRLMSRP